MFNSQFFGLNGHFFLVWPDLDYLRLSVLGSHNCGQLEGCLQAGCVRQNFKVIPNTCAFL